MAASPENFHKLSAVPESRSVMVAIPGSHYVMATVPKSTGYATTSALSSDIVSGHSGLPATMLSSSPAKALSVSEIDEVLSILPVLLWPFYVFGPHTPPQFPQRWQLPLQNLLRRWRPL